jgi:hypothetical protein
MSMGTGVTTELAENSAVAYRATEGLCITCGLSRGLDEDRPALGTITWAVGQAGRLATGSPVAFKCPNGHTSDDDPALLKAFHSRLF